MIFQSINHRFMNKSIYLLIKSIKREKVMKKIKTYLEFGYQEDGKKVPYDMRENQEAYDFFMVARYLKDIISHLNKFYLI